MSMDEYEMLRESFRPKNIRVLFVGESRPANGTFYYRGDSRLARYTCQAFGLEAISEMSGFLRRFHSRGCFLTDLCAQPVNSLPRQERTAARRGGVAALADTIASARPLVIVVVMIGIATAVKRASAIAGANAIPRYNLPFPAQGHERDYVAKLRSIVSCLEKDGVLNIAR